MQTPTIEFDVFKNNKKCLNDFVLDQDGRLYALVGAGRKDGINNFHLILADPKIYKSKFYLRGNNKIEIKHASQALISLNIALSEFLKDEREGIDQDEIVSRGMKLIEKLKKDNNAKTKE